MELPQDGWDYGITSNSTAVMEGSASTSRHRSIHEHVGTSEPSSASSIACQQPTFTMAHCQHGQQQQQLQQESAPSHQWEQYYSSVNSVDLRGIHVSADVAPRSSDAMRQTSYWNNDLQQSTLQTNQRPSFVSKTQHDIYTGDSRTVVSEATSIYTSQVTYQGNIIDPSVYHYGSIGRYAIPAANDHRSSEVQQPEVSHNKFCGVCGDVARSYHFGGLSCDSCKAFFRRSVQNDNYLRFQCYHTGQCVLSVNNRKSCQYCRMRRCFEIGMEKSWVMTEDERKALMKIRSERKLTKQMVTAAAATVPSVTSAKNKTIKRSSSTSSLSKVKEINDYVPLVERMTDYMSLLEIKEIESIVTKYAHAYQQVPYRSELRNFDSARPGFQTMEMFGTLVRRFAFYARMMADFASLPSQDQRTLLKGGVFEMCLLRGALVFDPVNNHWPNTNMSLYKEAPLLKLDDITQIASSHLFQMHLEFIGSMKQLRIDEPTIMLLVLIVLFTHRPGLLRPTWVEKYQAYYVSLLEHYTQWRFGPSCSKAIFSKLLTKLSDLRELSETHNPRNVNFGAEEISSIQQQLQHLNINPYPEFNLIPLNDDTSPNDQVQQEAVQSVGGSQEAVQQSQLSLPHSQRVDNQLHELQSGDILSNATIVADHSSTSYSTSQENSFNNYPAQVPADAVSAAHRSDASSFANEQHLNYSSSNVNQQSQQPSVSYVYNDGDTIRSSASSHRGAPSFQQGTSFGDPNPQHFATTGSEHNMSSGLDMSMQFMRAMQQSVSQVLDQPHFGFEWVQPDYAFDGFDDDAEELGQVLDDSSNSQEPASSSSQHADSTITQHTLNSSQSTGIAVRKYKTENLEKTETRNAQVSARSTTNAQPDLTPIAIEELYYELERYSELYNQ